MHVRVRDRTDKDYLPVHPCLLGQRIQMIIELAISNQEKICVNTLYRPYQALLVLFWSQVADADYRRLVKREYFFRVL